MPAHMTCSFFYFLADTDGLQCMRMAHTSETYRRPVPCSLMTAPSCTAQTATQRHTATQQLCDAQQSLHLCSAGLCCGVSLTDIACSTVAEGQQLGAADTNTCMKGVLLHCNQYLFHAGTPTQQGKCSTGHLDATGTLRDRTSYDHRHTLFT